MREIGSRKLMRFSTGPADFLIALSGRISGDDQIIRVLINPGATCHGAH